MGTPSAAHVREGQTLEDAAVEAAAARASSSFGRLLALRHDPYAIVTALLVTVLLAAVALPDLIAQTSPDLLHAGPNLAPPSAAHPFGTDDLGRDIFSRVVHGLRISLLSGAGVVIAASILGSVVGLVAGYAEGWVDEVLMRVADMFVAFPTLIMAMAIVAVLGAGLFHSMLAIALIWWPQYARLLRSQVLVESSKEYVLAARALGASGSRIAFHHVLPNCLNPILVRASLDLGSALLLTASLSFLGLGAQPPSPELGATVTEGRNFLLNGWWYPTFPGLALFLCVMGSSMLGDVVRDWWDPRR